MDENTNSAADKKVRKKRMATETGKCSFCPPHSHENGKKKARPDKYKTKRKGK